MNAPVRDTFDGQQVWDGVWRLPSSAELSDGFYSVHQFTAKQLLQARAPRNQWEGTFLQIVLLQKETLSNLQEFCLDRLVRAHAQAERRVA